MADERIILTGPDKLLRPVITQVMAQHQLLCNKDIGEFYGQSVEDFDEQQSYKPYVRLVFQQDENAVTGGKTPATAELSFKLMDLTSKTITNNNLNFLADKIKKVFGTGSKYLWKKGKKYCTYKDLEHGYNLQMLVLSVAEAKDLAKAVVSIQGHAYADKNLLLHEDQDESSNYPDNPPKISILGDTYSEPHQRPKIDVRFAYATCNIWLKKKPIYLVDTVHKSSHSLLR